MTEVALSVLFRTGVIPAKAGTQCRTIFALGAEGEIALGSSLRGNDAQYLEALGD